MKNTKKLTRTQRNILVRLGHKDTWSIRYLEERGDFVVFVHETTGEILISKQEYYKQKG